MNERKGNAYVVSLTSPRIFLVCLEISKRSCDADSRVQNYATVFKLLNVIFFNIISQELLPVHRNSMFFCVNSGI